MAEPDLTNEVLRLRSQNMSNEEIAQKLMYQGYTNAQIFDAISTTDVDNASEGNQNMEYTEDTTQYDYQQPELAQSMPQQAIERKEIDSSKIAEIAESIIEDKWSDLVDHVNRIIEWKSSMELKLNAMDEQIKSLKGEFETLNKNILGRINDSDNTMREVGTDIKALEQVFKKILPGFVENVNELSRITQRLKK